MSPVVSHDMHAKRFLCQVNGLVCFVGYSINETEPLVIDIFKTYVHPDLRGKGVAEHLMISAIEWAQQEHFTIKPSCSYAVLYFKRHKAHQSLVAAGVDLDNSGSCRLT